MSEPALLQPLPQVDLTGLTGAAFTETTIDDTEASFDSVIEKLLEPTEPSAHGAFDPLIDQHQTLPGSALPEPAAPPSTLR